MARGFEFAKMDAGALKPAPIAAAWIIQGAPCARARELVRSSDGTCVTVDWDCTAGTFHWYFVSEETVHILAGSVSVTDAAGFSMILGPGDVAVFPAGRWMVWQVETYVRKLAVCRYPVPRQFGRLVRWTRNGIGALRVPRPPIHATRPHGA
jgi:uncharacterized cupin superfamily protein